MRVPVVRRWVVAVVVFLTALTSAVLGVGAGPAAAADPRSKPPVVTAMSDSGGGVRVGFKDRSVDEDAFQLFRRGLNGFLEYVVEAPTRDKPGQSLQSALVDPNPNALRCYVVTAYDNAGGVNLWSQPECVDGGLDPFDTRSGTRVAAPRITAVAESPSGANIRVRVDYVDRSRNESRFKLFRRHGGVWVFISETTTTTRTGVGQSRSFEHILAPNNANACFTVQAVNDTTSLSNYSPEVCVTPPAPRPAPRAGAAMSRPVRIGVPDVFTLEAGSMAVGSDGLPIMSMQGPLQHDFHSPRLGVVHCNDTTCATSTSTRFDDLGHDSTITIGRDGLALIAYRGRDGLGVAHCSNLTCTDATLTTLDTSLTRTTAPSVSIGSDGLPTIAYQVAGQEGQPNLVKVARCTTQACTGATVRVIDSVPRVDGRVAAVASSPVTGYTYVAYAAAVLGGPGRSHNVMKLATCPTPACTGGVSINTVDWGHDEYLYDGSVAMTVGRDDLPLLTYRAHDNVVAAHCVNIHCTDVTTAVVNDHEPSGGVSLFPHVAIGADGLGVIAYNGDAGANVVHCNDIACRTFSRANVTTSGTGVASVAIGTDGLPVVFHGDAHTTLRLLHCPNATCSGGPFSPPETTGPLTGIDGKCAEVLLASRDNGTPIQLRPCSGHVAQNWTVGRDFTLRALGKCLNIAGAATGNGTPIQLHDCNGHWAQVWQQGPRGTLRNPASGKCLDTALHSDVDFIRLVLWECIPNTNSQIWQPPVP